MTAFPPPPFPGKGVTMVQPLRGFRALTAILLGTARRRTA
jgi:hypothetical protein